MLRSRWERYPIGVDSRSGHSLVGHGSSLYVVGGRADKLVERYSHLSVDDQNTCGGLHADLQALIDASSVVPMKKLPSSRKDHTSVACGSDLAVVYGGETFDGKVREPSSELFLVQLGAHEQWFNLGRIEFGRQGHAMVNVADRLIVHGGLGKHGVCDETFAIHLVR